MLAKPGGRLGAKIAPVCFCDFSALTREPYLLPMAPTKILCSYTSTAQHVLLQSGFEKTIVPGRDLFQPADPTQAASARRTTHPVWSVEFAESCPPEFIRQLRAMQDQGQNVAIYVPAATLQPFGGSMRRRDRDPMWVDANGWYYTRAHPWPEPSLLLYDNTGTLIFQWGDSGHLLDTYGIMADPNNIDGGNGRVRFPSTRPPLGQVYAEYTQLIYGNLQVVPNDPIPFGDHPVYGPALSIQGMDFPLVERTYRLHLTVAPPSGITSAIIDPTETASAQSLYGATTPILAGLGTDPSGVLHTNTQNVIGDGSTHYDLWGVYVSVPMAGQIIPAGTVSRMLACYNAVGTRGLYLSYFAYVWRPGLGYVATLSLATAGELFLTDSGTEDAVSDNLTAGSTTGATLASDILILPGDRIVVELWGKWDFDSSSVPKVCVFEGDEVDETPANGSLPAAGHMTMWFELSNLLYVSQT